MALAFAVVAYRYIGGEWLMFACLFFLPDLSMLGYLVNRRVGAALYNAGHTYLAPAAVALVAYSLGLSRFYCPALIWAAHIGFDRLMGYGLKYGTAFGATHLGWKGNRKDISGGR